MTYRAVRARFNALKRQGKRPTMLMVAYLEEGLACLIRSGKEVLFRYPDNFRPKLKEDTNYSYWEHEGSKFYGNAHRDMNLENGFIV